MSRGSRNVATATAKVLVDIDANAARAKNEVNGLVKSLKGVKLGKDLNKEFTDLVKDFNSSLTKLKTQAAQGIESPTNKKELNKDYKEVKSILTKIKSMVSDVSNTPLLELIDDSEIKKIGEATKALEEYEKARKSYEKTQRKKENLKPKLEKAREAYEEGKQKRVIDQSDFDAQKSKVSIAKSQATRTRNSYNKAVEELNAGSTKRTAEEVEALKKKMDEAADKAEKLKNELNEVVGSNDIKKLEQDFEGLNSKIESLGKDPLLTLKEKLTNLGLGDLVSKDFAQIKQEIEGMSPAALDRVSKVLDTITKNMGNVTDETKTMGKTLEESFSNYDKAYEHQQDISMLTGQVRQFFTFSNGIQIFKDAVRDAISTVKELDAAMTETAVVTDYSIGDMWAQLPKYTKKANELGATTKGVYETMTLYYQQGLDQQQAFAVGEETLKMARIAGLDYANATNLMTSALRGFNMEINETSAKRINDVYSELAAITAADTNEIATAMTKVASIADSANMSFENTSAFLSQIIETTREAPETAGTALKTIIARFSEVKKMVSEGALSGVDGDGEAIEINKIDSALEKVGISLKDYISGKSGLDEIFLQLAQKWDSLSLATQRYL